MTEITDIEDVKLLVNTFYGKVRRDDQLADIFNNAIQNRWPEHLEKMYCFWQTVLLGDHTYYGSPFAPHAKLPIQPKHFERWLSLFNTTVESILKARKPWKLNGARAKWHVCSK